MPVKVLPDPVSHCPNFGIPVRRNTLIINQKTARVTHPFPGVTRRVLANSPGVMLTEHTLEKEAVLPDHNHPHEQLVYLLSGQIVVEMAGTQLKLVQGDSFVIPPNVYHKVTALEPSVALDIFVPAREDYL
jgi:quercetin dioxygenase-like cupin family protein